MFFDVTKDLPLIGCKTYMEGKTFVIMALPARTVRREALSGITFPDHASSLTMPTVSRPLRQGGLASQPEQVREALDSWRYGL